MDPAALLEGLTEAQAEAVRTDGAPLCVLAGAGSGKTRVLTRRIAYRAATGAADPRHTLALTFTRKAAHELRSRLGALGVREAVAAGTFHAMAYAQLRQRWDDAGQTPPTLLEGKVRLLSRLLGRSGRGRDAALQPMDLASEIEWAKARLVTPDRYEEEAARAGRRPPLPAAAMAGLYQSYEEAKVARRLIDFDDLILACGQALAADAEFAARQRWRFRHLFVDEVQDLNPAQRRLLEGWRGGRPDLCVVGDPDQAIYAWNGADASYLTDFARRLPGATVLALDDNFRSSPQVLAVAHAVLSDDGHSARPLRPHQADGPVPTVRAFASDADEARGIARALRDRRHPGRPWSHLAVLVRTNAQTVVLAEALRAAGVPHRVRGGGAFLNQPEVRAALGNLSPSRPLVAALADLEEAARGGGGESEAEGEAAAGRRANLGELARLGREHLALDPDASGAGFVAWLGATLKAEPTGSPAAAVEVATFHAAKGLEWPVVFLAGLERGLVPLGHARTDEARDEERRLLYVAATRARQELHCSWARQRTTRGRTLPRTASPWLEGIEAARAALAAGAATEVEWKARLAAERARLRGGGNARASSRAGAGADPAMLAALKQWRSTTARTTGVPAYVIFHDTTLAAVAESRPRSRTSLLAVPGLGPVKADRYGDDLLALVAAHAS